MPRRSSSSSLRIGRRRLQCSQSRVNILKFDPLHCDLAQAKDASEGFGLFLRSLVGLDRQAAKAAFDRFLIGRQPSGQQIEFIDMIVNYLTEKGYMEPSRLYESPFTDLNPMGVEGVFRSDEVAELMGILKEMRQTASAAA